MRHFLIQCSSCLFVCLVQKPLHGYITCDNFITMCFYVFGLNKFAIPLIFHSLFVRNNLYSVVIILVFVKFNLVSVG